MAGIEQLSRSIAGKVAIVTGAASGMGRATAHLFAQEGAKVVLADLHQEPVEAVTKEITDAGGTAICFAFDVSDKKAIDAMVEKVIAEYGAIDIIVNNAGYANPVTMDMEGYEDEWDKSIAVMLTAQMHLIRTALPYLRQSDAARIVNISSTEGLGATPANSPYSVAKHGVIGLTRSLAVDLGREGITVNAISPGPIRTGITQDIPDEHKEIFAKRRVPLRRYGIPEEVAHITLSLVLPAASFLNGVVIPVDGGLTIKNA